MPIRRSGLTLSVSVLAVAFVSGSARAEPYGAAFRIGGGSGHQVIRSVATGANGDTALLVDDGSATGPVSLSRYAASGQPLRPSSIEVTPTSTDVAVRGDGAVAVADQGPDGGGRGVFVTIFDRAGNVAVPRFRVNANVAGDQFITAIAMNARGQFVVLWWDGNGRAVYAKHFQANGAATTSEVLVAAMSDNSIRQDVAIDDAGNFVVVWDVRVNRVTNDFDCFARRYNAFAAPIGAAFRVNSYTTSVQASARIAMNAAGAFVIVWTSYGQLAADKWGIYGQRFNANGSPLGGELAVSTRSSTMQEGLAVAMAGDGGFMAVWHDENRLIEQYQVFARSYAANGASLGDPVAVTTTADGRNTFPEAGMDPDGNAFLAWRRYDPLTGDYDSYGRRYSPANVAVQPLARDQVVTDLTGAVDSWQYFKITVPPGHNTFDVTMNGPAGGDADLYVRYGALPSLTRWDGRPFRDGSNEAVRMSSFPPGDWYIGIHGYAAYAGVSLVGKSN
jgi:serine protease